MVDETRDDNDADMQSAICNNKEPHLHNIAPTNQLVDNFVYTSNLKCQLLSIFLKTSVKIKTKEIWIISPVVRSICPTTC